MNHCKRIGICIDGGRDEGLQFSLRVAFSLLDKVPASEVADGSHSVFCYGIVLPYQ